MPAKLKLKPRRNPDPTPTTWHRVQISSARFCTIFQIQAANTCAKKNKREISQKPANWNENGDAKRSAQITLNMKSMKSVLQFARNATKIKFKGSHGIWVRLPIWTADFCTSGDANCFALENEWVKGEALEIIKLNARHFRFNQPPATREINSIHKSSQKKKKKHQWQQREKNK